MRIRKLARIFPSNLNDYTSPQNQREENEEIEDEIDSMESHNPPVEASENQEMAGFSSSLRPNTSGSMLRRGRGVGKLPRGWGDQEFKKLQVSLSEEGNLIGDDVIVYASACGVLARTPIRLPLHYKSWHEVPMAQKEEIWKEIQRNTTIPPEGRSLTLRMLGSCWRNFKSHIKRTYYEPHKNDVTPLCEDARVDQNQWRMLVDYWRMEETQRRAEMNRQSRGNNGNHRRTRRMRSKMVDEGQST